MIQFEWDEEKERKNIKKHGIDFRTAVLVFNDSNRLKWFDAIHSAEEFRYITIAQISQTLIVVVVVYTERECSLRIFSARLATKSEMEGYYGAVSYTHLCKRE